MKIIDFEKYGNVVRFYYGDDNCNDYRGDDWDNEPYDCNSGTVYDRFVKGWFDLAWDCDYTVCEPCNTKWSEESNFSKDDFKKMIAPCIVVCKYKNYDANYNFLIGNKNTIRIYYNDNVDYVKTKGIVLNEEKKIEKDPAEENC